MAMTVKAHAKINWALNILGIRPNGYHELDMLMQSIELHDEMTFHKADMLSLSVNGGPYEPDERNLVIRAAKALKSSDTSLSRRWSGPGRWWPATGRR